MTMGMNIAFISQHVAWRNFSIMTTHVNNEMTMRDIITVENGTMSESLLTVLLPSIFHVFIAFSGIKTLMLLMSYVSHDGDSRSETSVVRKRCGSIHPSNPH